MTGATAGRTGGARAALFAVLAMAAAAAAVAGAPAHMAAPHAWAQSQAITVDTSEPTYEEGDTIVVHGSVLHVIKDDTPVLLQVFYVRDGELQQRVHAAQLEVALDGSFTDIVRASGDLWSKQGEYRIQVHYSVNSEAETTFMLATASSNEESAVYEVGAGSSGTFDVPYTIVGGTLGSMRINPDSLGMSVFIAADKGGGSVTLELPRQYIDARTEGCEGSDEQYIMLVDGAQTPYEKVNAMSDARTVRVAFGEGSEHIEIIGTCVIPEFGPAAAVALAAALAGAAAAAALSRRISRNVQEVCG